MKVLNENLAKMIFVLTLVFTFRALITETDNQRDAFTDLKRHKREHTQTEQNEYEREQVR